MPDAAEIDRLRAEFQAALAEAATDRGAARRCATASSAARAASIAALMKALGDASPADARRALGQLVNAAQDRDRSARSTRSATALEPARPPAGAVDVTLPGRAGPARPPPSAHARARSRSRTIFSAHGLRDPRRPRDRRRLPQLRSAQHAAGASRARHAGHAVPRARRSSQRPSAAPGTRHERRPPPPERAATLLRTHTSAMQIRYMETLRAAGPHHRARPRLPPRQPRPHATRRCSSSSRGSSSARASRSPI